MQSKIDVLQATIDHLRYNMEEIGRSLRRATDSVVNPRDKLTHELNLTCPKKHALLYTAKDAKKAFLCSGCVSWDPNTVGSFWCMDCNVMFCVACAQHSRT